MRFNKLINNCNLFLKMAFEILPPEYEIENFEIPKAPKLPKTMEETIKSQRFKKDELSEEDNNDEHNYTILAPESLSSVKIPKAPKVPREFAITERPQKNASGD